MKVADDEKVAAITKIKKEEELEEINNFKNETVKYVYVPLKVVETSFYKYEEDNSDYLATA